jgi:hypothetical protein
MRAKLSDQIHALTQLIIAANDGGDEAAEVEAYTQLQALCHGNRNSNMNHPLQWEALGDFSATHAEAVAAYEEGLELAQKFKMKDFIASFKLALAESYLDAGDTVQAKALLSEAENAAQESDDYQIKGAINELRAELGV